MHYFFWQVNNLDLQSLGDSSPHPMEKEVLIIKSTLQHTLESLHTLEILSCNQILMEELHGSLPPVAEAQEKLGDFF